jgi:hypothetical protein
MTYVIYCWCHLTSVGAIMHAGAPNPCGAVNGGNTKSTFSVILSTFWRLVIWMSTFWRLVICMSAFQCQLPWKLFTTRNWMYLKNLISIKYIFSTRGRCYHHNFLRFSPIFCEKIGLKTNVMIHFSQNSAVFLSQKRQFFLRFFCWKYF